MTENYKIGLKTDFEHMIENLSSELNRSTLCDLNSSWSCFLGRYSAPLFLCQSFYFLLIFHLSFSVAQTKGSKELHGQKVDYGSNQEWLSTVDVRRHGLWPSKSGDPAMPRLRELWFLRVEDSLLLAMPSTVEVTI